MAGLAPDTATITASANTLNPSAKASQDGFQNCLATCCLQEIHLNAMMEVG